MSDEKRTNSIVKDKWLADLRQFVIKYGIEPDSIDWAHGLDWGLTYPELKNFVFNSFCTHTSKAIEEQYKNIDEAELREMQFKARNNILTLENLSKIHTVAVYGDTGSGKTALCYKLLESFKGKKPVYVLNHPKPELLIKFGYQKLNSLEDIETKRLQDCVIYWDEPQLSIAVYDNHSNMIIAKVCSLARQLGITLIISSSDTRVFTRHNEAYFDLWLIKDLDYGMVKNGSKIKNAIKKYVLFDASGFKLEINEFVSESRTLSDLNGRHTFGLPAGWTEEISKPYRNSQKNSQKNSELEG